MYKQVEFITVQHCCIYWTFLGLTRTVCYQQWNYNKSVQTIRVHNRSTLQHRLDSSFFFIVVITFAFFYINSKTNKQFLENYDIFVQTVRVRNRSTLQHLLDFSFGQHDLHFLGFTRTVVISSETNNLILENCNIFVQTVGVRNRLTLQNRLDSSFLFCRGQHDLRFLGFTRITISSETDNLFLENYNIYSYKRFEFFYSGPHNLFFI